MGAHLRQAHHAIPDAATMAFDESLATRGPPASYETTPPIVRDHPNFQAALGHSQAMRRQFVDKIKYHHDYLRQQVTQNGPHAPSSTTLPTVPPYLLAGPAVFVDRTGSAPSPSAVASASYSQLPIEGLSRAPVHDSPEAMGIDLPGDLRFPSSLAPGQSLGPTASSHSENPAEEMVAVFDSSTGECVFASMAEIEGYYGGLAVSP